MRSLLHIGLPKTGTTSLQQTFFPDLARSNAVRYLGKAYPKEPDQLDPGGNKGRFGTLGVPTGEGIARIQVPIKRHNRDSWASIADSALKAPPVILSNEVIVQGYEGVSFPEQMRIYHQVFDPIVVVTLREFGGWLRSFYGHQFWTRTRDGHTGYSADEFLADPEVRPCLSVLERGDRFEALAAQFDDILMVSGTSLINDLDYRRAFCARVGYPQPTETGLRSVHHQGVFRRPEAQTEIPEATLRFFERETAELERRFRHRADLHRWHEIAVREPVPVKGSRPT